MLAVKGVGYREQLTDSGSSICQMCMGQSTHRHGFPVFTLAPRFFSGGPTGLPASSTAEPGCPSSTTLPPSGLHLALLSRNSSPQADPSSRNTTPTPKTPFTCQLKRHVPGGFPDCPLPVLPQNLHALPISRFVTLAKALHAAFPLHACSPKKLTCLTPVCLPCFSPGLALSRPSTKSL